MSAAAEPIAGTWSHERKGHIPELDGLRGVAILSVILFHFGSPRLHPGALHNIMEFGWAGVDLFFVLSGFLITGILLRTRGSNRYFLNFYVRRILRIFPLYYGCIFLLFVVILPFVHAGPWFQLRSEQAWYWLHLSNFRTAWGPFSVSPVGHFWSLAVEEQFYLVWPVVILLLPEPTLLWLCMLIPLASSALRSMPALQEIARTHPEFLYRMTFCRLDGLALGACVAIVARNENLARAAVPMVRRYVLPFSAAGLATIMAADQTANYAGRWMSMIGYSVVALFLASVLLLIVVRNSPTHFLLPGWLISFGKYSYGVYMFHLPILFLLVRLLRIDGLLGCIAAVVIGGATSFFLAYISWCVYEVRFHRLKDRIAGPRSQWTLAAKRASYTIG